MVQQVSAREMERMMKVQEVILRAMAHLLGGVMVSINGKPHRSPMRWKWPTTKGSSIAT
jgi:hypothetical protein